MYSTLITYYKNKAVKLNNNVNNLNVQTLVWIKYLNYWSVKSLFKEMLKTSFEVWDILMAARLQIKYPWKIYEAFQM